MAGFTQGSGTTISTGVTNPYVLSGLSFGTSYSYYVRANCGGGTYSTWAGPLVFKTACPTYTAPFTEGFEGTIFPPMCWTRTTATQYWSRTTSASGYGNSTMCAYAFFYNYSSATPFDLATFAFDATGLYAPVLNFDYAYATYAGEIDEMDVYYSTNGGATFTLLHAMPGGNTGELNTGGAVSPGVFIPTASQWATKSITLPAGTNMIRFTAISAYGNNLYLDNVAVVAGIPPCPAPTTLTSANVTATAADLNWVESGSATKWNLEYGAPGFVTGAGTLITGITSKPYHLSGLTQLTNYEFQVKADCGNSNLSGWSARAQFTTANSVPDNLPVTGTVTSGLPVCYNALNTITVAGNSTTFVMESGASATFIAGQKIFYLPGAWIKSGSYMHGYIAPTGPYCSTSKGGELSGQGVAPVAANAWFSIFPNPTNNNVTLIQKGDQLYNNVRVEIYSVNGVKMLSGSMIGEKQHEFNTAGLQSGIYFVRVVADNYSETIKLVKTR